VNDLSWTLLDNYDTLKKQEVTNLKPMLTSFYEFDLDYIYTKVLSLQSNIKSHFN
jgi:hypothetical protein